MRDRIIYAAPDANDPIGGVREIYHHVELLVRYGFDAAVWHEKQNFRPDWFRNDVPVIYGSNLQLENSDTLVVPAVAVFKSFDPAPGCRKVIFNQGYPFTFAHTAPIEHPRWDPIPQVWASSLMTFDVVMRLQHCLPIDGVRYIPQSINTNIFNPFESKQKKISWMPRKRPYEARVLQALFCADSRFRDYEKTVIDGLTEEQTAHELRSTSVFVSLGRDEGFGLPVAEAIASGCAVVGYAGGGGAELFKSPGTYSIHDSNVLGIVDQVASLIKEPPSNSQRLSYHAWIKRTYPESAQLEYLVKAIDLAQKTPAAGGTSTHPFSPLSN